jgi:hypothetical protein
MIKYSSSNNKVTYAYLTLLLLLLRTALLILGWLACLLSRLLLGNDARHGASPVKSSFTMPFSLLCS